MYELMAWLEASALAQFLRGLGVWTYGLLNLAHILGISTLFGAVLVLDLRLLGLWPQVRINDIIKPTVPLAAAGFVLAIISGVMMLSFNTTEYHANPFLYIKLPLILLGLLNVILVCRLAAWQRVRTGATPESTDKVVLAIAGGVSLLIWLGVITCGRMIGYW
jgi:hypothetical protein